MERVQIVRGENGVFWDARGRRLVTMGDINPRAGDWVWTNGTTIYGHREAGYTPPVFSGQPEPVLPVPFFSYQNGTNRVMDLEADGILGDFVSFTYKDKPILAYVGDEKHAYGGIYGNGNGYAWYNLITGDFLGYFRPEDACIAENGDLLTIESEKSSRYDAGTVESETYSLSACIIAEMVGAFETWIKSGMYCKKSTATPSPSSSAKGTVVLRRNGRVTQTIELDPYMKAAGNEAFFRASRIHDMNGGRGDGRTFVFHYRNYSDQSGEIQSGKIPRPAPVLKSMSADAGNLKIYPDGSYMGYVFTAGYALAYPVVETETNKAFVSKDPGATPREMVKDFFRASVSVGHIIGIGQTEGEYSHNISLSASGAFYGGAIAKLGSPPASTMSMFNPLPGHRLTATRYTGRASTVDTNASSENWVILSLDSIVYTGLIFENSRGKRIRHEILDAKMGPVSSEQDILAKNSIPKEYDIRNGFKVMLDLYDESQPSSVKALTLIGPDGKKVVTIENSSSWSVFLYNWAKMIACRLDKDRYAVMISQSYYPLLIIDKGKITAAGNGYALQCFSLVKFRNRSILEKGIWDLCGSKDGR
jgi:hypothetical protein|nr:MAG TPA: hypothetical protein [Caudoviricetes sp.]